MRYIPNERIPFAMGMRPVNGAASIDALAGELESRGFERIDMRYKIESPHYPQKPLNAWRKRVNDPLERGPCYDVIVNALIPEDIIVRVDDPTEKCLGEGPSLLCRHMAGVLEPHYIEYYPAGQEAVRQPYRAAVVTADSSSGTVLGKRGRGGAFVKSPALWR